MKKLENWGLKGRKSRLVWIIKCPHCGKYFNAEDACKCGFQRKIEQME